MTPDKHAVVVGAGISGLACAYRLKQSGISVTVLESAERPGGLIASAEKDGFLFESGPQSFQGTTVLLDLIQDLGIETDLLQANPRAPRYVLRNGRLLQIPMSPQAILTSSLLSTQSRWKVVSEPFRRTRPPTEDESVADFVRRKFGHEILEYLVSPFVSGVYAGDPEKLSLRAAFPTLDEWEREFGSVLRGALKSRPQDDRKGPPLCSFRRGMATLTRALAENLGDTLHFAACVESVHRTGGPAANEYEVRVVENGQSAAIRAQVVVLATPAYVASGLVKVISPPLAQTLSGIAYAPVVVVATGYYARQLPQPLNGFGLLIPRSENFHTLGTVWNSSLFVGRAPQGCVAMASFVGGATDPEIVAEPDEKICAIVSDENARTLGITPPPLASAVWKYPKALPQYNLGHGHVVEAIRASERATPGLFFSGNYLEGPSIGKCVEHGFRAADSVRAYMQALA